MSFDGLFTRAIVHELKEKLLNGRITKIHQPFKNELLLKIRANRKNYQLLLSAHPQYARAQLTNLTFENPIQPPQFCMVLRKYIENSMLVDIIQVDNDRIIEFVFTGRDELGDEQYYHLIVEIMGRHSNILLVNKTENKLYEAIRHIPPSLNSYRTLLPGAEYRPAPKQENINPFEFSGDLAISAETTKEKIQAVQSQFQGFGRDSAKELVYQIDKHSDKNAKQIFDSFLEPYRTHSYLPSLTEKENRTSFTAVPYESIEGDRETFNLLGDLLDEFYENKAEKDRVHQQANDLIHLLNNERKKNVNKLDKLFKERNEAEDADVYRIKGEVLTAYMHLVESGMEQIELENFYLDNEPMTISLDPQKTPAQNAQNYFSKYQKLKSRLKHLATQIPLTEQEIDYIDSVITQINVGSTQDIEEIREELREQGYLKKQRKTQKKKQKKSKPEEYYSSDGTLILVGKNNHQNDQLTMKTAQKTDWWLHTKDIPGSHVVIRGEYPSEQTLEEAALLAAYHSKFSSSSSVPVDYTQIKNVRKPNGAKPGFVIYDHQKTLFVTPNKKIVKQLKNPQ